MGKSLVVGYGNPLLGDDGVGRAVVQALAEAAVIDQFEVVGCHQLTPELAERLAAVDLVVFIDAGAGVEPGSVVVTPVQSVLPQSSALVHHLEPGALVRMSRELYGRSPDAFLVTVGAGSFALSEELSEVAAAALPRAVAAVRKLMQRLQEGDTL